MSFANPILDLRLLRIQTYWASVVGGFLFRIGVGATPFLLAVAAPARIRHDALPVRADHLRRHRRRAGDESDRPDRPQPIRLSRDARVQRPDQFRLSRRSTGFFHARTRRRLCLLIALFVGGFFRSLQFTALNALAYADVAQERMSSATSLSSVAQQLALSCGVAIAAAVGRGDAPFVVGRRDRLSRFSAGLFRRRRDFRRLSADFLSPASANAGAALAGDPRRRKAELARNGPF